LSVFLSIDSCLSAESYEDAMHKMRKKIFLEQKQEHHIDRILLGHHQDDQLEHFFIGLCRGSSIKRISGMKKDSGVFYRPFLDCPKKEIIDTLKAKKISFLDDPTNQLSFSLRNNLRKKIIPQLDEVEKRARGHILSFLKKLQSQEACLEKIKRREWERIVKSDQSFDVRDFLMIDDVLQNLILQSLWYRYNPLVVFTQGIYDEIKRFFIYGKKTKHQIENIVIKKKRHMISFSS
jgi:tRNA(Ile)-lysidine synthase